MSVKSEKNVMKLINKIPDIKIREAIDKLIKFIKILEKKYVLDLKYQYNRFDKKKFMYEPKDVRYISHRIPEYELNDLNKWDFRAYYKIFQGPKVDADWLKTGLVQLDDLLKIFLHNKDYLNILLEFLECPAKLLTKTLNFNKDKISRRIYPYGDLLDSLIRYYHVAWGENVYILDYPQGLRLIYDNWIRDEYCPNYLLRKSLDEILEMKKEFLGLLKKAEEYELPADIRKFIIAIRKIDNYLEKKGSRYFNEFRDMFWKKIKKEKIRKKFPKIDNFNKFLYPFSYSNPETDLALKSCYNCIHYNDGKYYKIDRYCGISEIILNYRDFHEGLNKFNFPCTLIFKKEHFGNYDDAFNVKSARKREKIEDPNYLCPFYILDEKHFLKSLKEYYKFIKEKEKLLEKKKISEGIKDIFLECKDCGKTSPLFAKYCLHCG
ncbi:MAG: hypothetical protein ACTSRP_10825, partial [Candidatus Helarchaeota archaeon]